MNKKTILLVLGLILAIGGLLLAFWGLVLAEEEGPWLWDPVHKVPVQNSPFYWPLALHGILFDAGLLIAIAGSIMVLIYRNWS